MNSAAFLCNIDVAESDFRFISDQLSGDLKASRIYTQTLQEEEAITSPNGSAQVTLFFFVQRQDSTTELFEELLQRQVRMLPTGVRDNLRSLCLIDCAKSATTKVSPKNVLKQRLDVLTRLFEGQVECDVLLCDYSTWCDLENRLRLTIDELRPLSDTECTEEVLLVFYHNLRAVNQRHVYHRNSTQLSRGDPDSASPRSIYY